MSDPKKTSREVLKGTWQEQHSYSLGVKTAGRTTIYLAGVGAWEDDSGKSSLVILTGRCELALSRSVGTWRR